MNDHPYDEQAKYYEERECLMQERIDYLKVEIEYLQNDRKKRIDKWMELLEEKDKHIEHLQDEIERLEAALAKSCEEGRDEMYDCGFNALKAEIERLEANAVTMEEYINDIAKPKIERLTAELTERADEHSDRAVALHKAKAEIEESERQTRAQLKRVRQRDERIEKLQDELVNLEALAKDRYCAMQTKIEVFYDALYEIAYLDPIRRIQGDAQRIARQAIKDYGDE